MFREHALCSAQNSPTRHCVRRINVQLSHRVYYDLRETKESLQLRHGMETQGHILFPNSTCSATLQRR